MAMDTGASPAVGGAAVAAATAMAAGMDIGILAFVFIVVLVVVACAIGAYILAMQQAKREIVKAFEEHIAVLHNDHIDFVEKYSIKGHED